MIPEPPPGLCGDCRHARALATASGATRYRCLRAENDGRYEKWPRLPMLSCPGHEGGEPEAMV